MQGTAAAAQVHGNGCRIMLPTCTAAAGGHVWAPYFCMQWSSFVAACMHGLGQLLQTCLVQLHCSIASNMQPELILCMRLCCLQEPLVGTFPFASSKQSNSNNVHQGRCLAHMFVMRVAEELETWPEYPQRKRCWVSEQCRRPCWDSRLVFSGSWPNNAEALGSSV